ncbi:MAG: phosphocholine cytidylyltransferase family protein [Oscillatoria sp. SIO1A7]|nr:phosphocholine cytidylyltransferase family protein [Oscillatoria sp. SIO1A7]
MKCLIIAAGQGTRLRSKGEIKPLTPILGVPLIERVIHSTLEAGVSEFYIVTGYRSERISDFLDKLGDRLSIFIQTIHNEDWQKQNGISVLKAQEHLQDPFLLLMADHIFEPSIVSTLLEYPLAENDVALAVDRNIENPLIDLDDVTRVQTENEKIQRIGKGLKDFNAFDTGVFFCTPAIFKALEFCQNRYDNTSLSAAVQSLADRGRAKAIDVSDRFWIDVDTSADYQLAEDALLGRQGN